jgi:hypothetical protein
MDKQEQSTPEKMEEYFRKESMKKEDYKTCGQFAIAYAILQLVKKPKDKYHGREI